jgi:hypothetical protein
VGIQTWRAQGESLLKRNPSPLVVLRATGLWTNRKGQSLSSIGVCPQVSTPAVNEPKMGGKVAQILRLRQFASLTSTWPENRRNFFGSCSNQTSLLQQTRYPPGWPLPGEPLKSSQRRSQVPVLIWMGRSSGFRQPSYGRRSTGFPQCTSAGDSIDSIRSLVRSNT